MTKKSLAEKMAEKAMNSEPFQNAWAIHERVFGPILTPAFAENMVARVHLVNALNHISRRESAKGMGLLEKIKSACVSDADYAAWYFFMGLAYEMVQDMAKMAEGYAHAIVYNPPFYLPYLKLAKYQHQTGALEEAAENFEKGISYLKASAENAQTTQLLAATYANFAATLTMQHRFEDAKEALLESERLLPALAGRDATWAVLMASLGDESGADAYLEKVKLTAPPLYEPTKKVVLDILAKKNAHISAISSDEKDMDAFWLFFWKVEEKIRTLWKENDPTEWDPALYPIVREMKTKLTHLFPSVERTPELTLTKEDGIFRFTVKTFYNKTLEEGCATLFSRRPEDLDLYWRFEMTK